MKNINFRVSTVKFIAQNIIIQLDHSLGRETNQKYSYLPVFMMKFTNFIKFGKQHCGCKLQPRLSLQIYNHMSDNLIELTHIKYQTSNINR